MPLAEQKGQIATDPLSSKAAILRDGANRCRGGYLFGMLLDYGNNTVEDGCESAKVDGIRLRFHDFVRKHRLSVLSRGISIVAIVELLSLDDCRLYGSVEKVLHLRRRRVRPKRRGDHV